MNCQYCGKLMRELPRLDNDSDKRWLGCNRCGETVIEQKVSLTGRVVMLPSGLDIWSWPPVDCCKEKRWVKRNNPPPKKTKLLRVFLNLFF